MSYILAYLLLMIKQQFLKFKKQGVKAMKKLAKSALLTASVAAGILTGAVQAHQSQALMFFEFSGTHADNDPITIPCEATDYLATKDYNLDPSVPSPMGNPTGVVIKYETNYGNLSEGDQIHIKLHNAKTSNNLTKCVLVFYEKNGVDTNADGIGDTDHDANGDGDSLDSLVIAESMGSVQNVRELHFRVTNNGTSYPSNGILYLACAEQGEPPLAAEDRGSAPATYNQMYNLVIVPDDLYDENDHSNLCSNPQIDNKVCLTVRANACCPNTDLELPDLGIRTPQCFMDVACQFALSMKPSQSIINMYPKGLGSVDCTNSKNGIFKCYDTSYEPGTQFVNVGYTRGSRDDILYSDSCTDNDAADGTISIINDNDNKVDDDIVLGRNGWQGKLRVSLYDVTDTYACSNRDVGSYRAYKALDFGHNRVFLDNNGDDTTTTGNHILFNSGRACELEANVKSVGAGPGEINLPMNDTWTDDVYMGVTGKDRLYWVKWGLEEVLEIYKDNNLQFTVSMDEDAQCVKFECCYDNEGNQPYFKKWEPNGQEAYIPHLLNNGLTYVK